MKRFINLFAMAIIIFSAMAGSKKQANVNLESYMGQEMGLMPAKEAKQVLDGLFMHHPSYLDELSVEVFKIQKRSNMNVALLYVGRQQDYFDTEMYAITYDPKWNRIDGAFLGYSGDALLLIPTNLPADMVYEPDLDLNFSMRGDTLKMEREYKLYSKNGGKSEEGIIMSRFLLRKDGRLHQWPIDVRPKRTNGNIEGTFDFVGSSIMRIIQYPIATVPNFDDWNEVAKIGIDIASKYGENPPQNLETQRNEDFAKWVANAGIRNGKDFFSWVSLNYKKQVLTYFVRDAINKSGMKEGDWLKEQVKACKDKKARKWWENWMKKEVNLNL